MENPRIVANLSKFRHNLQYLSQKLVDHGIEVGCVTKVFSAQPELVEVATAIPTIHYLCDSRVENLASYPKDITQQRVLLRVPMISEADEVVQHADISLNSQIETIRALNEAAQAHDVVHQIVLMVDLGDLREGVFEPAEVESYVAEILTLPAIQLRGLGVNLTCYGAIIPTGEILSRLGDYQRQLEDQFDITLDLISGGNSSSLYLLDSSTDSLPQAITQLRVGEAFVLGVETAYGEPIEGMYQDVFNLVGEIVEYRDKPSMPIGESGQDAFGEKPVFEDRGTMRRGIVALGRQDVNHEQIQPMDERIEILGASSDHLILDFTKAQADYQVGSEVLFKLSYGSLMNCYTSKYVHKEFIEEDE